ncbi:FAD-dependent monooxygenase [Gloeothece verrucosa]|uniref:Monooxygenase FAD-binding protein n=1 Tax=Gloeothece verrucosa (strain PCC 7822) TaxID=497965 RepID=E0UE75_GLOV7|nr:FAD-dependent monooxygenase [Gloeothece verrucosa]ADN14200.1 monooxygenase FAD-binding protein [Gloeothece verrucosa PCC 7822]
MSSSLNPEKEILIVGAGPVGLTMAASLAQSGISCRIIDKADAPSQWSKALGIFPRTLEVFENLGVIKPVLETGKPLHKINLQAQQQRLGSVSFNTVNSPYPFVISLPQSQTERILREHLAHLGVKVQQNVELVGLKPHEGGVTATLHHADGQQETYQPSWLVGCDGSRSKVRELLGIPFVGSHYQESFVLADVKIDGSLPDNEATAFYYADGVLALFPLPGERFRVIISWPQKLAASEPTLAQIQALVDRASALNLQLSDPIWISKFHISRRKVRQYRMGRVFLAGDAAHVHSPAGGQGMNTGIQDAHNLGWKLALVAAGLSPSSLLDSYQIEREPVASEVLLFTDMITRVATLRNPFAQFLRNVMMSVGMKISAITVRGANTLAEVNISYRHSPIVANSQPSFFANLNPGTVKAGDRAPDAQLHQLSGQPVRIFELLGKRQVLLLFIDGEILSKIYQNWWAKVREIEENYPETITVYPIFSRKELATDLEKNYSILIDSEQRFAQQYQITESCLYLIRPDGYICFCSPLSEWERLQAYLKRIFY